MRFWLRYQRCPSRCTRCWRGTPPSPCQCRYLMRSEAPLSLTSPLKNAFFKTEFYNKQNTCKKIYVSYHFHFDTAPDPRICFMKKRVRLRPKMKKILTFIIILFLLMIQTIIVMLFYKPTILKCSYICTL